MKVREHTLPGEKQPRHLHHAIHVGSGGANVHLSGIINNPDYPQSYLGIGVLVPQATDDEIYTPPMSAQLHINLEQVDQLIADLQEQRLRMLPKEG